MTQGGATESYYGLPVIKDTVWGAPEVPGYLFLGGLAGASSALAASADLSGYPVLARTSKTAAVAAIGLSVGALVKDLGRPKRFLNMLRVFKPTSPMSIGTWIISAYSPAAGVAAASALTGLQPAIGRAATIAAAVTGPGVAAYTAALLSDTAVPAWHEAHRELPYLFVSSAATAAGGLALALVPPREAAPARNLALTGAGAELIAKGLLLRRLGPAAEPYQHGRAGRLMEAAEILTAAGLTAAALGGRNRLVAAAAGTALVASSACTRFGIFYAGRQSARDPAYTVAPQKGRLRRRQEENSLSGTNRAVSYRTRRTDIINRRYRHLPIPCYYWSMVIRREEYLVTTARDLGAALKHFRSAAGVTQADAAEAMGVGQPYLSSLEAGKFGSSLTHALRLLRFVGCEVVVRPRQRRG